MAFKSQTSWQAVPAQVIGRDFSLWSRGLLLSKGSRQGVRSGLAVITSLGLAGRITDVGPTTSRMMLLTDPHFRSAAVLTSSRTAGLVMGTASGDCLVTYLPLEKTFQPGELVATSGGTSFAPAGISIGKVVSSWEDASKLYRAARLVPSVQGAALEEVLVVAWNPSDSP